MSLVFYLVTFSHNDKKHCMTRENIKMLKSKENKNTILLWMLSATVPLQFIAEDESEHSIFLEHTLCLQTSTFYSYSIYCINGSVFPYRVQLLKRITNCLLTVPGAFDFLNIFLSTLMQKSIQLFHRIFDLL